MTADIDRGTSYQGPDYEAALTALADSADLPELKAALASPELRATAAERINDIAEARQAARAAEVESPSLAMQALRDAEYNPYALQALADQEAELSAYELEL
jgi:hypothetical protein